MTLTPRPTTRSPRRAPTLGHHGASYELCLYCPSLCRHACPVATAEGSDTLAPQRLMALADHLREGRLQVTPDIAMTLHACSGCGACTAACQYDNPVADALVEARASLMEAGHSPVPASTIDIPTLSPEHPVFEGLRRRSRYEEHPAVSLMPSRQVVTDEPQVIELLFDLCERLDEQPLACGELARVPTGFTSWFFGHHKVFADRAARVVAAARGARDVIVMSPEALHVLKNVYPRFGFVVPGTVSHISEFLLPILSGAVVKRLSGRVGYLESAYLANHCGLTEVPRQVLRRMLVEPLIEVPLGGEVGDGGSGLEPLYTGAAEKMAEAAIARALRLGVERLVSFSPEAVVTTRAVARALGVPLQVEHAVGLVAEAVVGDGVGSP